MRLTTEQQTQIKELYLEHAPRQTTLFLFGSRTDPNKRGGDIDLMITCKTEEAYRETLKNKFKIMAKISLALDDQKVDLALFRQDSTDPFYLLVKEHAIEMARK